MFLFVSCVDPTRGRIFFVCTWMVDACVLCSELTWPIELLVARIIDVLPGSFG